MRIDFFLRLRVGLLTIGLLAMPVLFVMLSAGNSTPDVRGPIVVLSAPWSHPDADIVAAGGWIVGPQRAFFGVLSTSDDPEYGQHLAALGYWTLQDSALARLICGVST